jgi:hypothetical protein
MDPTAPSWARVLVLPAGLPPGTTAVYKKPVTGGTLGCLVQALPNGALVVHVSHTVADVATQKAGRMPTLEEIADALNRFTPEGASFGFVYVSGMMRPNETAPQANVAIFSQLVARVGTGNGRRPSLLA